MALSWQLDVRAMVWLLRLPGLNMMSHNRFVFAAGFSILALAAQGLELLGQGRLKTRSWFSIPIVGLTLLLVLMVFLAAVSPGRISAFLASAVNRDPAIARVYGADVTRQIQWNFLQTYLVTAGLCLLGTVGWRWILLGNERSSLRPEPGRPAVPSPRWFSTAAATLMIAELLWNGYGRSAQCDWPLYYPEIPVLSDIARASKLNHSRVIGAGRLTLATLDEAEKKNLVVLGGGHECEDCLASLPWFVRAELQPIVRALHYVEPVLAMVPGCLPANLAQTQGLSDVRGYDAVDPARYVNLVLKAADPRSLSLPYALTETMVPAMQASGTGSLSRTLRLHPILDMLSVRYVIFRGKPLGGIVPAFQGEDYWAMENQAALPRVLVPRRVETVAGPQQCLDRIADLAFDAREVAYVESELAAPLPATCRGRAEITCDTPGEVRVRASMETAGMLVLADRWDPGVACLHKRGRRGPGESSADRAGQLCPSRRGVVCR